MAVTTDHTVTGYSATVTGSEILYMVDFDTGSGVGTAQLQIQIDGNWYPAEAQRTGTMINPRMTDITKPGERPFRWYVTVTSGTIRTVLDKN